MENCGEKTELKHHETIYIYIYVILTCSSSQSCNLVVRSSPGTFRVYIYIYAKPSFKGEFDMR
jgi:hypothetical protein